MDHNTAILFIHGFMGTPKQFDFYLSKLPIASDIYCVTLPGHQAPLFDFCRAGKTDWQESVETYLEVLRKTYDRIIIVSHSMGGLLAINSALKNPCKINAIIAIALPLFIRITFRGINIRLRLLLSQKSDESEVVSVSRGLCGVYGLSFLNSFRLIPNAIDFIKLQIMVRKKISLLNVPITIINSCQDEIISKKTLKFLCKRLPEANRIKLSQSSHFWYSEHEKETILREIKNSMI